jgi:pyruvate-formate lyase-activating enzyme
MASKTVKLNGEEIPCGDVLKIEMKMVSDEIFYEITYRKTEPMYHELHILMDKDKAHKLEQKVRKCCAK